MSKLNLVLGEVFYVNSESKVRILKAEEQTQGLKVAVKEYTVTDISLGNQALREALAMSRLSHPSMVQIYDFYLGQSASGQLTINIVMELMDEDLSKAIERRRRDQHPWTEAEIWGVLRKLIFALAFAERQNVSHRDLKPPNIFLSGNEVKIGDFGASAYAINPHLSMRSIQGSPLYLSPELKAAYMRFLMSNERLVAYDPVKSDVYSLGMTILHMALLEQPLALASIQHLEDKTREVLAGLEQYRGLQPWLASMLAVSAEDRLSFVSLEECINRAETANSQSVSFDLPNQPVSECVNCERCGQVVDVWTSSEPFYSDLRDLFPLYCSTNCLDATFDIFPKSQCVKCKLPIEAVTLACGHMMHSICKQQVEQGKSADCCMNCPHQYQCQKRDLSHPAPEEVPEAIRKSGSKLFEGYDDLLWEKVPILRT